MEPKAQFCGQVEIIKVELTSIVTEVVVDLSAIMLEMNIYEDLFTNYLTGTISISDSLDLINNVPLIGEEKILISYRTPGSNDKTSLVENSFVVYKITDRVLIKDKAQVYVMHIMSEEAYYDSHIKVSKAYKGQLSHIAKKLFNDDDALGASEKIGKKFFVEDTANAFQFVVPTWSPMKALNWVAARSTTKNGNVANYVFYQDAFNYNFRSINSLITQDTSMKFWYTNLNVRQLRGLYSGDDINQYNIVRQSTNDLVFDVSSRMINGMYSSKLIICDLLSKTINVQEYDYIKNFSKSNHLNQYPLNSPKTLRNPNSCIITYVNHVDMYDEFSSDYPEAWVLQRRSLLQQIDAYVSEIVVPGHTSYKVGMTVDYEFNTVRNHTSYDESEERYHKGKYLVTNILHRFSKNEHECVMGIVNDSILTNLGG